MLLGAVSAFGLLIGIVTGVLSLLPQVSVSSSAPLNPLDPFSAPFIVNNTGFLSIHDGKYFCRLNNVVYEGAIIKNIASKTTALRTSIQPQEQDSVFCVILPEPIVQRGGPLQSADISIRMKFRPTWTLWEREQLYRFRTQKNKDRQLSWFPHPVGQDPTLEGPDPVLERRESSLLRSRGVGVRVV